MAFELHIANRREAQRRFPRSAPAAFAPASRIEIVGELDERSSVLVAERIDAELAAHGAGLLVSLDRASNVEWLALYRLVGKIQAARRRGLDVRIVKPRASLRLLLGTMAMTEGLLVESNDLLNVARTVIIA